MIESQTIYKCTKCGAIYEDDPGKCKCEEKLIKGKQAGNFMLVSKIPGPKRRWKVTCLLCDNYHEIAETNIKRQFSCGCVPKHIDIGEVKNGTVQYVCRKCDSSRHVRVPVAIYCCEGDK